VVDRVEAGTGDAGWEATVTPPVTLSLLDWTPPVAAPRAPAGAKRAAKAGNGNDAAILRCAPRWLNREVPLPEARADVETTKGGKVLEDTVRRRLHALRDAGYLTLGEPTKTGHVLVTSVAASAPGGTR
jgi:hypothetical protein